MKQNLPTSKLSIAFCGTGIFALNILSKIVNSGYTISVVYTKPNVNKLGKKTANGVVYQYAQDNNIAIATPKTLKNINQQQAFIANNFDIAIVASYGLILPKDVVNAPKYGCINVHGSVLPFWRGAAPIQMSILNNFAAGVTIIQMNEGLDTGDIISTTSYNIKENDYYSNLITELSDLGFILVLDVIKKLDGQQIINKIPQDNSMATHAKALNKEDGLINFVLNTAQYIQRQVRAFEVFPTSYFYYNQERIKVLNCSVFTNVAEGKAPNTAAPGTIIDVNKLQIMCANNSIIQINTLQRQSKTQMSYNSFKQGFTFILQDIIKTP